MPEFQMVLARKMPEFYIIIARKLFSPNFRGAGGAHAPAPTVTFDALGSVDPETDRVEQNDRSMAICDRLDRLHLLVHLTFLNPTQSHYQDSVVRPL